MTGPLHFPDLACGLLGAEEGKSSDSHVLVFLFIIPGVASSPLGHISPSMSRSPKGHKLLNQNSAGIQSQSSHTALLWELLEGSILIPPEYQVPHLQNENGSDMYPERHHEV